MFARNIALGVMTRQFHVDALIDTGATFCVIPPAIARILGFDSENRLSRERVNVVGGRELLDRHRLEYVTVGTTKAYDVEVVVSDTGPGSRLALLGMTFLKDFRTIVDLDESKVLFRKRKGY